MDMDLGALSKLLLDAVMQKNFGLVAALAVWCLVLALRKFGPSIPVIGKFLSLPLAGPILALLLSVSGYIGTTMMAGGHVTLAGLMSAILVAWGASGFHEKLQKLLESFKTQPPKVVDIRAADDFFKKEPPQ